MKSLYLTIVLSIICTFGLTDCKRQTSGNSILSSFKEIVAPTQRHDANIIGLIDFSKPATDNPDNGGLFCELAGQHIVKRLSINSSFVLLPIDKGSESDAPELIKIDLLSMCFVPQGTAPIDAKQVESCNCGKYKDTLCSVWTSSFDSIKKQREHHSIGTDIVGALKVAKQYCRKDEQNIVVFFSDMLMYVQGVNMENSNSTPAEAEKWLSHLEKIQLPGTTKVIVITGPQNNVELYSKTKTFWKRYFDQCNIELVEYSSENYQSLDRLLDNYLVR